MNGRLHPGSCVQYSRRLRQNCNINKLIKRPSGNTFASIVGTLHLVIQRPMVEGGEMEFDCNLEKTQINRKHKLHYTH